MKHAIINKETRHITYLAMLKIFDDNVQWRVDHKNHTIDKCRGFCITLSDAQPRMYNPDEIYNYPELTKYKPRNAKPYWWKCDDNGRDIRRKIIVKAIAKTDPNCKPFLIRLLNKLLHKH